jgi:hypothetical protein
MKTKSKPLKKKDKDVDTNSAKEFDDFMDRVKYVNPGRTFSREEMNAW